MVGVVIFITKVVTCAGATPSVTAKAKTRAPPAIAARAVYPQCVERIRPPSVSFHHRSGGHGCF